jgi:5-methylcytosine-specific restriction enzyme B
MTKLLRPLLLGLQKEFVLTEELIGRFHQDPRLSRALEKNGQRDLFVRFAQALHDHGMDWWTVRLDQAGSIRCGRNNTPEQGSKSVAAEVNPLHGGLRVRWGKPISDTDDWQPLDEALVAEVEDEAFASEFREKEKVDRPGRWPIDYAVGENAMTVEHPAGTDAPPLNRIFYGPPGTGKTYTTVEAALQILAPEVLKEPGSGNDRRKRLKDCFDKFCDSEQIVFCTFHQSFSYEDFVQGIRARTVDGKLDYTVEDGVFKRLCDRASRGVTAENDLFDLAIERFQQDLAEAEDSSLVLTTKKGKAFKVEPAGPHRVFAFPISSVDQQHDYTVYFKDVRRLYEGASAKDINNNSSYVWGVLDYLRKQCGLEPYSPPEAGVASTEKFVLIIDEINRGNVSRIFGELITLIEPSKRAGQDEALSVVLPYSEAGERFSVPDNVYIIGTMNTADRSLAGLDLALRRRFVFREMPPLPELLDNVEIEGLNIGQLMRVMNQRIEVLLDRDHRLGHAYFMPLKEDRTFTRLERIFRNQIMPLLQEYFFEDWERISWVLNDLQDTTGSEPFVRDLATEQDIGKLFGKATAGKVNGRRWETKLFMLKQSWTTRFPKLTVCCLGP